MAMRKDSTMYARTAEGFERERNDCAVRAMSLVLNRPYSEVHQDLAARGRRDGRGTRNTIISDSMLVLTADVGQRAIESEWLHVRTKAPTLATFVRERPHGRYLVLVRGHALAVIDGVVHDWTNGGSGARSRVIKYWRVEA